MVPLVRRGLAAARRYFAGLTLPRTILWCYFLWYVVMAGRYFDPNPRLWLTSVGLSVIVGVALLLNAGVAAGGRRPDRWSSFRFFLMPFCVSSFAALVKGRGFVLVFSPRWSDVLLGATACAALIGVRHAARPGGGSIERVRATSGSSPPDSCMLP